MMSVELESSGRFGNALFHALSEREMSLRDLAAKTDGTYEHMRKITKGIAYPSRLLLKEICKTLHLNLDEMDRLISQDKLQHRYGKNAYAMSSRDPRSARFDEVVPYLSDEQVDMFLTQMKAVTRNNRQKKGA
jgi:transcriptional regulator with XRE-family HTH domain